MARPATTQTGLFGNAEWWEEYWRGMPEFVQEDLAPVHSIQFSFFSDAAVEAFEKAVGQRIPNYEKRTPSIWFPEAEIGHFADKRYRARSPLVPKYPVYIISRGRWDTRFTSKALEKMGIPYSIVVEPQEFDRYAAVIDPAKIITLPFSTDGTQGATPGFVVTAENWTEVLDAVKLYKSAGASNVRIAPHFTAGNVLAFYHDARRLVAEAQKEETETFKVFSRFEDKYAEIQSPPEDKLCGYQYFTTYIGADQRLYRCCVYAYNPSGLIGDLRDRRFVEVWPEVFREFHRFDSRGCIGCHYKDINRTLAYALAPRAVDEEFV